jgi:peptidoglycan/xylan/chitin deacetylase (PgdA/CDA1 family)
MILTYHRVLEKWEPALDYSQPGVVVTAETFARQLAFVCQYFDVVPLSALIDDTAARPTPRPRCVVTFDDGWRDNYELAFPILRKHRVPATIFVTTGFMGSERVFWHTELIYLLVHGNLMKYVRDGGELAQFPGGVRDGLRRWAGPPGASGAGDTDAVVEAVKATCDEAATERLIEALATAAGLRRPLFPGRRFFLDWDQIREMASHDVEIGSHGVSHRILTRLPRHEAAQELVRSKSEIEDRLGREVWHFAFPNEYADDALIASAARAGYRTVCTNRGGDGARGIRVLRRAGMNEGVSLGGRSSAEAMLGWHLLRAPRSRPV